jgi:uncharacterized membrane protein
MDGAVSASEGPAPRTVDAGRGVSWWTEAWALFVKSAALWVVFGVIVFVALFVLGLLYIIGAVVGSLLLPVFMGGWMLAARKLEGGGALEVNDLFACFKGGKLSPLLVVGALFLAGMAVIGVLAAVLGFGAIAGLAVGGAHQNVSSMMAGAGVGLIAMLVALVLGTLVGMALWFAPALVVFRGMAPVDAMRLSFSASVKNLVPFLLYGLIYIVASIVATVLLFGLGWLVLGPLAMLTLYVSYRDVFGS